jgi:DNA-directed RNA polymerase specialized sigma24 family protein
VRSFQYDSSRSFRGWLRRLYRSRLSDFLKSEQRRRDREHLAAHAAPKPTLPDLLCQADQSRQAADLTKKSQRIQAQIRHRVSPKTWSIFEQIAVHGMDIADVASQHEVRYAAAFAACSRVQRMLRAAAEAEARE